MAYREELEYLYGLERFGMIFGLQNVSELLGLLGNPHWGLKVVHVAGTNGKGSVCAMLHAVLSRRYKVGLYTSPHLHRFNERIRIQDEISDEEVVALTRLLRSKVEEAGRPEHFTFFDFTTAMALYYFAQKGVDLAIVEVGLGGRLDSTNVVNPLVTVITNVGHDHIDVLGSDLTEIAREKAGVIKAGIPVVCGEGKEAPRRVIEEEAKMKGAPLYLLGRDFRWQRDEGGLNFEGRRWRFKGLSVGLSGAHQLENAALALATLQLLDEEGLEIGEEDVRIGLRTVRWPGRFELFHGPPRVLLDGAHNPEGAKALKVSLGEIPYRDLHLILGIMADKEWKGVLEELVPGASTVVACRPQTSRALDPEEIVRETRRWNVRAWTVEDPAEALKQLKEIAKLEDLIVVSGSLFTVAEVREALLGGR